MPPQPPRSPPINASGFAVPTAEELAELARGAFEAGRLAHDPAEAVRWLDRAHRLAHDDATFALALAQSLLGRDDRRAARLLAAIAARHDVREAWLALAAARHRAGDCRGAAEALGDALARHAFLPRLAPLADAIARAAGAPGWCGLDQDGALLIGPAGLHPIVHRDTDGLIRVRAIGRPLLGTPIDSMRLKRTEGFVEPTEAGTVRGWAWLPFNPDRDPGLVVRGADGRTVPVRVENGADASSASGLLVRRRAFEADGAGLVPPLRVLGEDGRDLLGSPLPTGVACAPAGRRRLGPARPGAVVVIVPVHGGGRMVLDCLGTVRATLPAFASLVVVEDGRPDSTLARRLGALAGSGAFSLLAGPEARGFPAAANRGLAAARGRDAILLNSDTLVAPGWIEALREAAYSAPDIGTVTPLSNNGGFLSYPHHDRLNAVPDRTGTRRLAAAARGANAARVVEVPVGVGFCLYMRRDCLAEAGKLRTDLFAQGYGEENDFCLRAAALGWRHVAAPGVFVAHVGSASMGAAAKDLQRRNSEIIERLHPGYHSRVAAFIAADPLFPARRAIDLHRFSAKRATAIVTHDQGGGVERAVEAHASAAGGAILLRPAQLADGTAAVRVEAPGTADLPSLMFALPVEMPALLALLRRAGVIRVAFHHLLGHADAIRGLPALLGVPYEAHVHDYAWLCPRVVLLGAGGAYCGEPDLAGCARCIARGGSFIDGIDDAATLRRQSAALLGSAERVIAPSADAAARIARYFPGVMPAVHPHDRVVAPAAQPRGTGEARIAVIGAIGPPKGYELLLAMVRDAARRRLPLSFVVVGHTTGDAALLATGRAFVTGPFAPDEAESLIRAQNAAMAFLPSVIPETWSFALSDAWRAGLQVAAFDLGAQAERIRAAGNGLLLPPGCGAARVNDALLAACGGFRHEDAPENAERVKNVRKRRRAASTREPSATGSLPEPYRRAEGLGPSDDAGVRPLLHHRRGPLRPE